MDSDWLPMFAESHRMTGLQSITRSCHPAPTSPWPSCPPACALALARESPGTRASHTHPATSTRATVRTPAASTGWEWPAADESDLDEKSLCRMLSGGYQAHGIMCVSLIVYAPSARLSNLLLADFYLVVRGTSKRVSFDLDKCSRMACFLNN